eukprot:2638519-Rhodomonas_salina.2
MCAAGGYPSPSQLGLWGSGGWVRGGAELWTRGVTITAKSERSASLLIGGGAHRQGDGEQT